MSRKYPMVAVVLTAFVLSACGSSSSSSSTSSSSTSTKSSTPAATTSTSSATAPTGAAIKVGAICSCSGVQAASIGLMSKISNVWADSVNAAGGINGHPVKMFALDDGGNPATSLQDAKELVEQDHVIAMVGEFSLADASWASFVASKGIPVVGGISPESSFLTNPDFYPSGSQLVMQTVGTIALAKVAHKTKIGVAYCAESPICAQVVPLVEGIATSYGLKSAAVKISSTAPSYAAPCLSLKGNGVDALFVADNSAIVQRMVAGCAQQGYSPANVNQTSTTTNAWLKQATLNGSLLSGFNASPYNTSTPGVAAFTAALEKFAPGVLSSPEFSSDTIGPWAGGMLFQAAAKAADIGPTSTGADVKKGLYMLKNATLGGLTGPLNFTAGKPSFVPCYFTDEQKNGKFVALNDNKPTCLPAAQAATLLKALHL